MGEKKCKWLVIKSLNVRCPTFLLPKMQLVVVNRLWASPKNPPGGVGDFCGSQKLRRTTRERWTGSQKSRPGAWRHGAEAKNPDHGAGRGWLPAAGRTTARRRNFLMSGPASDDDEPDFLPLEMRLDLARIKPSAQTGRREKGDARRAIQKVRQLS